LVLNLFNHPEVGQMLQDRFSVLYYVCRLLNNKEDKNLDLIIPPEIRGTVDDVMNDIAEKEKFYGYRK